MTKLLVVGSQNIDDLLRNYTARVVERARYNGYHIVCGDYFGVELQCWRSCAELAVPCTVHGIQSLPRNGAKNAPYQIIRPARTTEQRFEYLVKISDKVIGIWGGDTAHVIYAVLLAKQLNKDAWLYGAWRGKTVRNLVDLIDDIKKDIEQKGVDIGFLSVS